jgi:Lrp/AsnC ligand binding domain
LEPNWPSVGVFVGLFFGVFDIYWSPVLRSRPIGSTADRWAGSVCNLEKYKYKRSDNRREDNIMNTWAYVFIYSRQPKKVINNVRKISGVVHADALFGSPDIIAIVEGKDIKSMDAVIDKIAEIPQIINTDTKVARWINDVSLPFIEKKK